MSNNEISSVDYLISQLQKSKDWNRVLNEVSQMSTAKVDIIAEAKAMHKKEIENAWNDGSYKSSLLGAKDYYEETFGGNNEQ